MRIYIAIRLNGKQRRRFGYYDIYRLATNVPNICMVKISYVI